MKSDDTKEKMLLFYLKKPVYTKERLASLPPLLSGFPYTIYVERAQTNTERKG